MGSNRPCMGGNRSMEWKSTWIWGEHENSTQHVALRRQSYPQYHCAMRICMCQCARPHAIELSTEDQIQQSPSQVMRARQAGLISHWSYISQWCPHKHTHFNTAIITLAFITWILAMFLLTRSWESCYERTLSLVWLWGSAYYVVQAYNKWFSMNAIHCVY